MALRPVVKNLTKFFRTGPQGQRDGSDGAVVRSTQLTDELRAPSSRDTQAGFASTAAMGSGGQEAGQLEHVSLNPLQAQNRARFVEKLPAAAGPTTVFALPGGGCAFVSEVPGRIPGSKAVYEKQVDRCGNTTQYWKTTFDPQGNLIHAKDKIHGTEVVP